MDQRAPLRYSFAGGTTDKRRFPFDTWRTCVLQALRLQQRSPAFYKETEGDPELRLAISATWRSTAPCSATGTP